MQTNFKKYASGEGFVSAELAERIMHAGPSSVYANGTNGHVKSNRSSTDAST